MATTAMTTIAGMKRGDIGNPFHNNSAIHALQNDNPSRQYPQPARNLSPSKES